jgi:hypothetical protein
MILNVGIHAYHSEPVPSTSAGPVPSTSAGPVPSTSAGPVPSTYAGNVTVVDPLTAYTFDVEVKAENEPDDEVQTSKISNN